MSTAKHKGKGPQAMTGNDLREGYSVWMTVDYAWTPDFSQALKTEDVDIIEKMRKTANQDEDANKVVGVYFIDIETESGQPVRYREKFRVSGPSYDTADEIKKAKS